MVDGKCRHLQDHRPHLPAEQEDSEPVGRPAASGWSRKWPARRSGNLPFTDGAFLDSSFFDNTFPYLKTPLRGSPNGTGTH